MSNFTFQVFVHLLFHALYLAVKNSSVISEQRDQESVWFMSQLTSYLLLYLQEMIKSGNRKDSAFEKKQQFIRRARLYFKLRPKPGVYKIGQIVVVTLVPTYALPCFTEWKG